MTSVSAYFERAISASLRTNIAPYLFLIIVALTFYGCGSSDSSKTTTAPQAGPTSALGAAPQTAATGAAGSSSGATDATREQAAFTVQIGLKDGKFTAGTPMTVSIIEGVPLELEFDVRDDGKYPLVIVTGSGEVNKDLVLDTPGDYATQFPALKRDDVFKVSLGEATIEITAGFEPGP